MHGVDRRSARPPRRQPSRPDGRSLLKRHRQRRRRRVQQRPTRPAGTAAGDARGWTGSAGERIGQQGEAAALLIWSSQGVGSGNWEGSPRLAAANTKLTGSDGGRGVCGCRTQDFTSDDEVSKMSSSRRQAAQSEAQSSNPVMVSGAACSNRLGGPGVGVSQPLTAALLAASALTVPHLVSYAGGASRGAADHLAEAAEGEHAQQAGRLHDLGRPRARPAVPLRLATPPHPLPPEGTN